MKDVLILVLLLIVYSGTMIFAGMMLERAYVNRLMPRVLDAEFMRGAKMGAEFQKADDARNVLQGVPCEPKKIGEHDESLAH